MPIFTICAFWPKQMVKLQLHYDCAVCISCNTVFILECESVGISCTINKNNNNNNNKENCVVN